MTKRSEYGRDIRMLWRHLREGEEALIKARTLMLERAEINVAMLRHLDIVLMEVAQVRVQAAAEAGIQMEYGTDFLGT